MDAISEDMEDIHAVNLKTRTPTYLNVMSLGLGIMPQEESEKRDLWDLNDFPQDFVFYHIQFHFLVDNVNKSL